MAKPVSARSEPRFSFRFKRNVFTVVCSALTLSLPGFIVMQPVLVPPRNGLSLSKPKTLTLRQLVLMETPTVLELKEDVI